LCIKVKEFITEIIDNDIRRVITDRSIDEIDNLSFISNSKFEKARDLQISEITDLVETKSDSIKPEVEEQLNYLFKKLRLTNKQKLILIEKSRTKWYAV
jgi:hypothetical protein